MVMRTALVAVVAAVAAVGVARAIASLNDSPPAPRAAVALTPPRPDSNPASIAKAADGHYWAEADVGGKRVRFLVDTGATAVALTAEDARRLGYDPATLTYNYKVTTASGEARAAEVTLPSVAVAGARVSNVQAFVIEDGLETSLLGMTYLGRLSAFEATPTSLILRP